MKRFNTRTNKEQLLSLLPLFMTGLVAGQRIRIPMIRDRSDIPEPKFDELVARISNDYKRVFVGKTTFKENLGFDNYYGEMYIGPKNAPIRFALDTKADQMVVKLGNCKGCTGSGKYDAYMDESTHFNEENEAMKHITYGYNTDIIGN